MKRISPLWCSAEPGSSRMTESAVTDLPEPDSPTSATVSPLSMSNDAPSTATVAVPATRNWMPRLRTERRGRRSPQGVQNLGEGFRSLRDLDHGLGPGSESWSASKYRQSRQNGRRRMVGVRQLQGSMRPQLDRLVDYFATDRSEIDELLNSTASRPPAARPATTASTWRETSSRPRASAAEVASGSSPQTAGAPSSPAVCRSSASAPRRRQAAPRRGQGRRRASCECLPRVECVAHRLADEDQQRQHDRDRQEAGQPQPRRVDVVLALRQQLAERRRADRQAEAQKIERGQRRDRAVEDERQEGQRRHHGVRQQVAEHDRAVGDAERPRRVDVLEVPPAQEFRAHHADQRHPREQEQDAEQHPEARRDHRRDDEQQIERRDRRPYLDEALEAEVDPAAEVALHRARRPRR